MVPLGSLVTFKEIAGPERVPRYNLFPSAEVQGSALPGISSGQALKIMRELAQEKLPPASPSSGPTCPSRRPGSGAPATTSSR